METRDGGIHKNINRLVSTIGGYDYKYHAGKIAEEYDLKKEDIIKIMEISETNAYNKTKGLFNMYFNRLKEGVPIAVIVAEERERSRRAYDRLMGMAGMMSNNIVSTLGCDSYGSIERTKR